MDRIQISIDVTKVDKSRLIQGQKGTYLNLILIPTPGNQYGDDYLVKQHQPLKKDEQGNPIHQPAEGRGVVLGSGRVLVPDKKEIPF